MVSMHGWKQLAGTSGTCKPNCIAHKHSVSDTHTHTHERQRHIAPITRTATRLPWATSNRQHRQHACSNQRAPAAQNQIQHQGGSETRPTHQHRTLLGPSLWQKRHVGQARVAAPCRPDTETISGSSSQKNQKQHQTEWSNHRLPKC